MNKRGIRVPIAILLTLGVVGGMLAAVLAGTPGLRAAGVSGTGGAPVTTGKAIKQDVWQRSETLVLKVYFRDIFERDRLATELAAEEVGTSGGFLTVWGDRALYTQLLARKLRVEIDEVATKEANNPTLFKQNSPNTFFGGYRTVEENYAYMDTLVAAYPNLAEKISIGTTWCRTHPGQCTQPDSWNGYDMYALHITNRSIAGPKPVFWFETGIHSREIATPEMATRFMSLLLDGYANDPDAHWLVDYQDIWVLPHVNPDGHHMVENGGAAPRTQRKNADKDDGCTVYPPSDSSQLGTDLNRNFPFLWGCCGGSNPAPCNLIYRGTASGSEEETQNVITKIRSLVADQRGPNNGDAAPVDATGIYQSMHTYAGLNLYPWGWTTSAAPNGPDLANIGNHMSAVNAGGNGYTAGQPPNVLYAVDGDTADWGYGELGIPSYTTELRGTSGGFFPPYTDIPALWAENKGMLTHMTKIARTPYLLTHGPDANTVATNPMTTTAGTPVALTASINFAWTSNSFSQNVAAAEYYIDTPPWAGGTAIPMAPTDGTFNSPTEGAQATIATGSLPNGLHIIYVRGRGANSYAGFPTWGPISAAFLRITSGGATVTPTVTPGGPTATRTATALPPTITPTASPTVCSSNYAIATATGSTLVPGTTFVTGSNCDDCVNAITLPFPFRLYDQTFNTANADSNGTLQFLSSVSTFSNTCLPHTAANYVILPHWDDLLLTGSNQGIYTSTTGSAPNRIFNIEWRGGYFSGGGTVDFEVRLYENSPTSQFDIVYGTVTQTGTSATIGVQKGNGSSFTQFSCNTASLSAGLTLTFTQPPCGTAGPTNTPGAPTGTATRTATAVLPTVTVPVLPTLTLPGGATATRTLTPGVPPTNTPGGPQPTPSCTAPSTWSDQAHIPVLKGRAVGVTVGSLIYVFGGRPDNTTYTQDVYRYDTATNTWTLLAAQFPDQQSANMGGGLLTFPEGQRLFVVGGSGTGGSYTGRAVAFDPAAGTFATKATWPAAPARLPGGWAVANNKFYIFGGIVSGTTSYDDNWVYDPTTNAWTQLPTTLSLARGYIATELMPDGLIYLAGGSQVEPGALTDETVFEKYNPATNAITTGPPLPVAKSNNSGYNVNGKFVVPGGGFVTTGDETLIYDPLLNSWSTGSTLVFPVRNYAKGYGPNGTIYAIGGLNADASEFYDYNQRYAAGPCVTPSVTPGTTSTATRTATPGVGVTGTATVPPVASATRTVAPGVTATATVCPIQFQDVAVTDPFYTFIRCLACRGIISGYTCGGAGEPCVPPGNNPYFRTGALITRAQVSKMVSLAAGLNAPIPSGQQTFEDVPSSNPFWVYIERLATAGYISGYGCGGANEPCQPPGNRPYFRPFASITRGQLAKIVSNANGYTDVIPSAQQTFEDVTSVNPFWTFVERVSIHGVISGYTCGSVGEPCVPPGNRPYFRPFASTTRGQASKIVANTFFPGCTTPQR